MIADLRGPVAQACWEPVNRETIFAITLPHLPAENTKSPSWPDVGFYPWILNLPLDLV